MSVVSPSIHSLFTSFIPLIFAKISHMCVFSVLLSSFSRHHFHLKCQFFSSLLPIPVLPTKSRLTNKQCLFMCVCFLYASIMWPGCLASQDRDTYVIQKENTQRLSSHFFFNSRRTCPQRDREERDMAHSSPVQ